MEHVVEPVMDLLSGTDVVEGLPEELRDTAMAVMNSSVGVLSVALEGIEEGAADAGLPRTTTRTFLRQTMMTAALLLQGRGGSPADLKDQVASPGGTTIAGLAVLEDHGVRGACIRAIEMGAKPGSDAVRRGPVSRG
jgi:pyrroline-5-carboxylate reductase